MKQYYILGLWALGMMTSCQNKIDGLDELTPQSKVKVTASLDFTPDSRTALQADGNSYKVVWSKSDAFSVFYGSPDAKSKFELTTGEGETTAIFESSNFKVSSGIESGPNGFAVVAYYPYSDATTVSKNGADYILDTEIPENQSYIENSFAQNASPMVAVTDGSLTFSFKNVASALRVPLLGDKKIVKATLTASSKIAGPAKVTAVSTNNWIPEVSIEDTKGFSTIVLSCGEGVELNSTEATNFIFVLKPGTYPAGMVVKFYASDGSYYSYTTQGEQTFTRSIVTYIKDKTYGTTGTGHDNGTDQDNGTAGIEEANKELANGVENVNVRIAETDEEPTLELPATTSDNPTNINFETIPEGTKVTIQASTESNNQEAKTVNISVPASQDGYDFDINLPNSTVTLSANDGESTTYKEVSAATAKNTLIIAPSVTIKNLIVEKGNVRVKKGGVINSISTTEINETIYVIYEDEIPDNVQNTENLKHITADYWESASDGAIYKDGEVVMLKSGSLKKVLGDDRLNIASLKVAGEINGDDICCLREMAGRDAYQNKTDGKLEILDLSEASIIEGGSYYYKSSTLSCYTAKDVIGERMFSSTNLKEVQLPKGIVLIEAWAFYSCEKLQSATVYDKVESIKDGAFSSCRSLSSINIPSLVEEIGFQAFVNCTNLEQVELPDGLKRLGGGAFAGCGLASIVLPNSVESVGSELLAGCKSLTTVTLSESLGYVGDAMFRDCTGLRSIDIPDGIHTIGNSAFEGCTQLYDVSIPESVTTIRDYAFYNCDVLAQITLPEKLEKISSYLFYGCDQLWSVNIPDGVDEIGREAFSNCRSLKTIEIPSSVKTIGYSAFFYSSLTGKMIIPGSVETIGGGAFGATSLSAIELGEGIKTIGGGAFSSTNIKNITIPESVETIEAYAFRECYQLTDAHILGPTEIKPNVFYKCSQLESIWFYSLTPSEKSDTSMGGVAFNNPPCVLRVPSKAYDAYYKIYGNSSFTVITY